VRYTGRYLPPEQMSRRATADGLGVRAGPSLLCIASIASARGGARRACAEIAYQRLRMPGPRATSSAGRA
jgi:hypothetical protein